MRILIADDHQIVLHGLKGIVEEEFLDSVISEASDGQELLRMVRANEFDLVITDISMPHLNGLEALKQLKVEFPKLPVLVLSMHSAEEYGIRVLRAGASGYLTKGSANEELVKAIWQIIRGKKYITPVLAEKLLDSLNAEDTGIDQLSDREFEVFRFIASGNTPSEIAERLHLSVNTISTYRTRVLEKLGLQNNAEIMRYALDHGILPL